MCYFARTDYRCGDWRWGNMKVRCQRQPRIGETCGARLADTDNVTQVDEDCRLCQEIVIKQRRLQKERDNIRRWSLEGDRFRASIERAQREAKQLEQTIEDMRSRRISVVMSRKTGRPINQTA
ncbi:hypothetical protein HRR83_004979 [Exophiala dermatitidis]|uniref:Uncharacterized protein n=1 Tax=Exophiala dermatitidis TaxID=5970 RepID=A0AAN6EU84_EXODE|nr:hypothetical protein HRR74_004858 [Exophiala dermatitidis]KAJ4519715.1 hypothetical protein HRR73_003775 [Exophiala dermatitidis]KAJ4534482.1 hypothetical protein HRR76_006408 [Exophiala dermatitidis]KAJ4541296.1 hypothetical protein HRR77_006093 [Exophiala dermatitidis]KAJ4564158.1 hypothetical protein HRR79_006184 [Exophiala dermatitidis]